MDRRVVGYYKVVASKACLDAMGRENVKTSRTRPDDVYPYTVETERQAWDAAVLASLNREGGRVCQWTRTRVGVPVIGETRHRDAAPPTYAGGAS